MNGLRNTDYRVALAGQNFWDLALVLIGVFPYPVLFELLKAKDQRFAAWKEMFFD